MQGNIYNERALNKTLVSTPSSLDGYTPRNQKLRTYPYLYLGFNPPSGDRKIFRYENFSDSIPSFDIISEVTPNPSVYFIPKNYRGGGDNSLADNCCCNGYPTLSYATDTYNTWLAQNSQIISLNMQNQAQNYGINQVSTGINGVMSTNQESIGIGVVQEGINVR